MNGASRMISTSIIENHGSRNWTSGDGNVTNPMTRGTKYAALRITTPRADAMPNRRVTKLAAATGGVPTAVTE